MLRKQNFISSNSIYLILHANLDIMVKAFAFPTLPSRGLTRSATSSTALSCSRRPVRMATMSRPVSKNSIFDDNEPTPSAPVHAPEVAAVATAVCEFMNREHVRDIANYVIHFGRQFVSFLLSFDFFSYVIDERTHVHYFSFFLSAVSLSFLFHSFTDYRTDELSCFMFANGFEQL